MKAKCLLDSFNILGDEPETVQQFRKLLVGLAVSGKLAATSEATIDPSTLIKLIEERKRAHVQKGQLRKQNAVARVKSENFLKAFSSPGDFVRLGSIARIEKGLTGIMNAEPGPYPLVVTAEDRSSCDHFDFDGAAAIVPLVSSAGHGKASLQRLHYQEGKFALGSILAAIFPHAPELISARFLFEYLTAFKDELLVSQMIGTANVSLSVGKVSDVPVPLVSPSVQQKVDELMALCDQLEVARAEREATRDRLAAASLARLNAPDPKTFQEDARFALDALPALTTRPDQIKQLRQTILDLAVRGKLLPQDPADEPTKSIVLEIIQKKRGQMLETIEEPFELPRGWAWRAIDTMAEQVTDGEHSTPLRISKQEVPLVTAKNVREGFMDYAQTDWVGRATARKAWMRCRPQVGDILLVCVGATTGRLTVLREHRDMVLVRSVALIRPSCCVDPEYLERAIRSPMGQEQIWASVKAAAQPCLYINRIKSMYIPLPPLAEQHRIVAKVDELMSLCDRLEASLTAAADTRRRLLDALLHEALAPATAREAAA